MSAAKPITCNGQDAFAIDDRVCHREHGDGVVTGTYGRTKLAVDFDNVGTKRVSPESLTYAAPMLHDALMALYRERDARRAKARAEFGRLIAEQADQVVGGNHHGAEIIAFPAARIVRRISHGRGVVVQESRLESIARDAGIVVAFPTRQASTPACLSGAVFPDHSGPNRPAVVSELRRSK
jgi:hypothetical protein